MDSSRRALLKNSFVLGAAGVAAVPLLATPLPQESKGSKGKEISDQFEDIEHQMFGKDEFEDADKKISGIEEASGFADVAQFTPPAPPKV
jgi:hypothetical protein